MTRIVRAGLLFVAACCLAPQAWAEKVGPEFLINTETSGLQERPSVAALAGGGFVVVWQSQSLQSEHGADVLAQLYAKSGNAVGEAFRVNTQKAKDQSRPNIATIADGGFLIVWQSVQDYEGFDYSYGIYGRRFNAAGQPIGVEFRANTYIPYNQKLPSVSRISDGGFVISWTSARQGDDANDAIYAQRYDAAGLPAGGELRVSVHARHSQTSSAVAGLAEGGFVVVWTSFEQDGSGTGVFGRSYDSAGSPAGGEFRVNEFTTEDQSGAQIAALTSGDFVVIWVSQRADGSRNGIYGRRFSAAGAPVGDEFRINKGTANDQYNASVAPRADGGFIVVWQSFVDETQPHIYGRRFDAASEPQGKDFRISTTQLPGYSPTSIAMLGGKNTFIVVWEAEEILGQLCKKKC